MLGARTVLSLARRILEPATERDNIDELSLWLWWQLRRAGHDETDRARVKMAEDKRVTGRLQGQ
jgi:hypothetical protein